MATFERGYWRDSEALVAAYKQYGTIDKAAEGTGTTSKTLHSWWRRHGLPPLSPGPAGPEPVPENDDNWLLAALKSMGDEATVTELADKLDVSPRRVREALERLGEHGYRVREDPVGVHLERVPTESAERHVASPELFDGDFLRFAVCSDTHLASQAERPDMLETAYEVIAKEECPSVFHPGDLVDGLGIYRTQNTEVRLHTYEDQVDHATDVFPRREGVTTYIISGNHDLEGDFGKAGADPVQAVSNRRDDFVYLGRYSATVDLPNGASLQMLHPMGGASYALSYKPQKIVEGYELGAKPNILLIGHWHRAGYFFTRGVHTLLAGTFQGPTTYSIRKAFGEPGFGFWIVECRLGDDGSVVRFKSEWYPFYAGRFVT